MIDTLERGEHSRIKKMNFQLLMRVGEPLVKSGNSNGPIEVKDLLDFSGKSVGPLNFEVTSEGFNGKISLRAPSNSKLFPPNDLIAQFIYSEERPKIDDNVIFLNRATDVQNVTRAGLGTAFAALGDEFLMSMAPKISQKNEGKPVWVIAIDISHISYEPRSKLFMKKIKRTWTGTILNELGYDFAANLDHQDLKLFLQDPGNEDILVKKLV